LKSSLLVFIQFASLGGLLILAYPFKLDFTSFLFLLLGCLLASWSILEMNKSKLKIFPEPSPKSILIKTGPYLWIRHPMYSSVLLVAIGLLLLNPSIIATMLLLVLIIDLHFKLGWEETMLSEKFEEYKIYQQQSKKLIPFIY
ncbi:MAG: hypothetical protein B7Y19_04940, partial [Sphingobacteriales bacterium 24-40-4]